MNAWTSPRTHAWRRFAAASRGAGVWDQSSQPWQPEHALGHDVLEDLGRTALDRVRARAQEAVGPVVVDDWRLPAADVHSELGQRLVRVGPLPLHKRALRS